MDHAQTDWLLVQRNVILGLLLALAAAAWALLVWQGAGADMDMAMASPTMGMRAPLFLAIWVVMMVAMMFPTAAPMILTFHKVQISKRQRGEAFVATWVFVAAYMLVWTLSGIAAYAGALPSRPLRRAPRYLRLLPPESAGRSLSWRASIRSRRLRTCACRSAARRSALS
jgi:predicted metal-binding membrane protein